MTLSHKLKTSLRKLLSAPFSISDTIDPELGETYELLGSHQVALRKDERIELEPVFRKFSTQHWILKKFTYSIRGNIVLDTSLGWALSGLKVLHYSNTSLSEQLFTPHKPNFLTWLKNRRAATYYPVLVWMPYGTSNYWHFLNDFVGAIYLLQDVIKERRPAILIHASVAKTSFFNELLGYSTFLSSLNYVTYTDYEWVRCDEFITARTYFGTRESLQDAISLLDNRPAVLTRPTDKIFISRAASSFRNASNLEAVNKFFVRHGFQVVLFDGLQVHEQIDLINSARVIAAFHGAGMVNLAFHQHPAEVTVIEIIPEDYINPCYAFLAEEMGMNYHCVGAGARNPADMYNFPVSLDKLETVLNRLGVI